MDNGETSSELGIEQPLNQLVLSSNEDLNLEYELLNHVLLPRFLPQTKRSDLYEQELELLSRMFEIIRLQNEWIPSQTIDMFQKFNHIQSDCFPETIFKYINELTPNNLFAMYLKEQNCVFSIYMLDDDKEISESTTVIVATFPGNLDATSINKDIGDFEVI